MNFISRIRSSLMRGVVLTAIADNTKSFIQFRNLKMSCETNSMYTSTIHNSSNCIDMRSDTVTQPSLEMKQAMIDAQLGDDVYGEDTTVNELEKRCSELFGKEAGLFVASGTMGNLLAVMAHCQRGDEIIVGRQNHIHRWEQGNYAQLANISATTLSVKEDGIMDVKDIEDSIRINDSHMPRTRLICLENTHNYAGGKALPISYLKSIRDLANRYNLLIHMDGARIYNAAIALGVKVSDIAVHADSVMMCFSKGLGAPIGSILVGSKPFIDVARRGRKAVGGGWRQAGILAAAAHVALDKADVTIRKDHHNAQILAAAINQRTPESFKKSLFACENGITNMVLLNCSNGINPSQVANFFQSRGILVMVFDSTRIRIVLHWGIGEKEIDRTLEVYEEFINSVSQ